MTDQQTLAAATPTIETISIRNLFGHYSYDLATADPDAEESSRLLFLYGDNGSGKTTILRILFHLLSPANDRGHRHALLRIPFRHFVVHFKNGLSVLAHREGDKFLGPYVMSIQDGDSTLARVRFSRGEGDETISSRENELDVAEQRSLVEFLDVLKHIGPAPYFIADDRSVSSDLIPGTPERPWYTYAEASVQGALPNVWLGPGHDSRQDSLDAAIKGAVAWFRQHAFQASQLGDDNANTIYTKVIQRIARFSALSDQETNDIITLQKRLVELEQRTDRYARFGLMPRFGGGQLLDLLVNAPNQTHLLISHVLKPHLDGIEARLNALADLQQIMEIFVQNLNLFFTDKQVAYTLRKGLTIMSRTGETLKPESLSSGEKQLLMLLCHTLSGRDQASVFIVDEPEISLNVKWQRQLVNTLLECTQGTSIQFVLATHSIELVAGHTDSVAQLVPMSEQLF